MCECVESETDVLLTMRIPAFVVSAVLFVCCTGTAFSAPTAISVSVDNGTRPYVTTTEASSTVLGSTLLTSTLNSLPSASAQTGYSEETTDKTTGVFTTQTPKNNSTGALTTSTLVTTDSILYFTVTKDSNQKPKTGANVTKSLATSTLPTGSSSTPTDVPSSAVTPSGEATDTTADYATSPHRRTSIMTANLTTQMPSTTEHSTSTNGENYTTLTATTPKDPLTTETANNSTTEGMSVKNTTESGLIYPGTGIPPNGTQTDTGSFAVTKDDANSTFLVSVSQHETDSTSQSADVTLETTLLPIPNDTEATTDITVSSGDVSTSDGIDTTVLSQTASFDVTTLSVDINSTIPTNTSTHLFTAAKLTTDELASQTAKPTTIAQTAAPTTKPEAQTPVLPPVGETTADKGAGEKKAEEPQSLTIILIVICASLLVILLALCVFTYVKFRKKSRSIRKRLTFKDDAIYENPIYHGRWEVPKDPEPTASSCPRSLPMLISSLPDEVARLSKDEDTGFRLQFMMLDKLSPSATREAATTDANTHKNRYRDILPFDFNRVKLSEEGDKSDYINASVVPGMRSEREYVTSQGPLERTAADHWRMIWELNIRIIAMLTTCEEGDLIFKAKCCQYWPNKENDSVNYGGIYVTLVSTTRLCRDNYKLKVLHIRKGKDSEPRKIQLFQYIKWPDRKNPEDPEAFLEYRNHVRREVSMSEEQHPVLVHCSAGVGRTGTFIAIDTLLQHMEERESIDVYGLVLRLRKYRVLLVQNASQYKFVHTCLLIVLDKLMKAEIDEGRKKAGQEGSPYENMVMGQRAVVGELGGLVHRGESGPPLQSSAVQNFLRKSKTNVEPVTVVDDQHSPNSEGMPSPVKIEEWPRPLSDPVPRPVVETPKEPRPFSPINKGDPGRALAKELGGMFQGGVDPHASPGKTAAIKAFLRNRDQDSEIVPRTQQLESHNGDSLVIDNRFREDSGKQTTCL